MSGDVSRRHVWTLAGGALALAASLSLLLSWLAHTDRRPEPRGSDPDAVEATLVDRVAGQVLRPGPLAEPHAELEGMSQCTRCHGRASEVADARCIACHGEIGERLEAGIPLHGRFTESCASCHPDHRGADAAMIELDHEAFQHDQTRYPLEGAHASVACEDCHRVAVDGIEQPVFRYQGVPFASCDGCHLDVHAGGEARRAPMRGIVRASFGGAPAPMARERREGHPLSGGDCADCHGEQSFRASGLRPAFDHDATSYPLRGAHRAVDCGACHTEAQRQAELERGLAPGRALQAGCASCHDDPHGGALEACASCHVEQGWSRGFDHTEHTRFALDPLHARLACGACHGDDRFSARGRECVSCHTDAGELLAGRWDGVQGDPDPHASLDCQDCHGGTLEANRASAFSGRCVDCHSGSYGPLLSTWSSELDRRAALALPGPGVERLRASGSHNFVLARRRLEALADGENRP